ncbi:MAG: hypothetical protein ABJH52_13295 [Henriciella sp.]
MLRTVTSFLWLIAALALGFEAMAQPCAIQVDLGATSHHEMMADMPCHDEMIAMIDQEQNQPEHGEPACCCAALLGNGVHADAPALDQPVPYLTTWATPMPENANSIFLEFEPPPPRA